MHCRLSRSLLKAGLVRNKRKSDIRLCIGMATRICKLTYSTGRQNIRKLLLLNGSLHAVIWKQNGHFVLTLEAANYAAFYIYVIKFLLLRNDKNLKTFPTDDKNMVTFPI